MVRELLCGDFYFFFIVYTQFSNTAAKTGLLQGGAKTVGTELSLATWTQHASRIPIKLKLIFRLPSNIP